MSHSFRGGSFFITISSAAGAAGELKQHKKEPNKESLTVLPGAHAREGVRTREGSAAADCRSAGGQSWRESVRTRDDANFSSWRVKTFGGNFDPVHEAIEDAVAAFSDRQASRDRSLWLKVANEIGFEAFRDLYLEQCSIMRECKLRNPAAAFQNRLNRYTGHNSGKGGAA